MMLHKKFSFNNGWTFSGQISYSRGNWTKDKNVGKDGIYVVPDFHLEAKEGCVQ